MAAIGDLAQGPTIDVDGTALPMALYTDLLDVRVEHTLSVASAFTVRFRDPDFELLDSNRFKIGATVDISFPGVDGSPVVVMKGEIVSLTSEQGAGELHELAVAGYDRSHRLGHESRVRSFQDMSYGDVIAAIARENGLQSQVDSSGTTTQFPYLLQTSTDYRFLTEIAFRIGHEWHVEDSTLVFRPRAWSTGTVLRYGETLRRFKARYSAAEHAQGVTVRGWNPSTQAGVVATDTNNLGSPPPEVRGSDAPLASPGGTFTSFNHPVMHSNAVFDAQAEATQYAQALAERRAAARFSARGEAVAQPQLKAGQTVTINGVGSSLTGTYYLTTVEHVFGAGRPLVTRFTVSGKEASTLVDLLGRADDPVGRWGRTGITVGVVTNNSDPDGLGRVRLKFPALSDGTESAWARIAVSGGGGSRGLMFMPEINDEVLVAFEHGDLRRPFVLGGLWNAKNAPPAAKEKFLKSGKVVEWTIKSRRGHVLTMRDGQDDRTGAFDLLLADGKTKLYLGEDKVELWSNDKPLQLKAGDATVTLDGTGNINIKGKNVTIEAQQALKLSGLSIEAKGSSTVKVEASANLELKASAAAKLESGGLLEAKGTILKLN